MRLPGSVRRRRRPLAGLTALALVPLGAATVTSPAAAAPAAPASVTIAGDLQSELGCGGDWDPSCTATGLTYDATDGVWQGTWTVPAGDWQYKAALDGSWAESYGAHTGADNVELHLGATRAVKFYYDPATHWVTDDVGSVVATAAGNFQSQLGCPGDWQPDCLRSWLEDPDGDGVYTFTTTGLRQGSYEAKAALDEGWATSYGRPDGSNLSFTVPADHASTTFRYDATTHAFSVQAQAPTSSHDGNVEWDGVRHDSRDPLYRSPGGAVTAGTPVTLRLRTYADDVTAVRLRLYDVDTATQTMLPMSRAATGVDCYQPGLPAGRTCDFWSVTVPEPKAATQWYRFVVTDGADTDYYGDDTAALDGGLGKVTDDAVDNSWALTVAEKDFTAPSWVQDAVIYQIFPDRFRNGRADNDPKTGDTRYDDPVRALAWGTRPEGYCHNYADASAQTCPWRFDAAPPADQPTEQPRGRDYQGGDLKGVDQNLDYLQSLGVNTLYLNPIFDSGSNHGYDTQDYLKVDPYFGTQKDFDNLVKHAHQRGMRVILDGVFNHMSSDSPMFDRYGHYSTVGACESVSSPYRAWFTFHPQADGPCAGPDGPHTMTYDGWFGFDSIPVLTKTDAQVQKYFLTSDDSVAKHWLRAGADGWRMDVMGDASFPDGYWQTFRQQVKQTKPDALIVSETWQKDSTLLRMLRGDRADSTMNYRLRDAVVGLLAPQGFDSKGFPDSGSPIAPTQFGDRIASMAEDYPDAALYSAMNLLDSHDTERLLWTLTPGPETTANKEGDAAHVAEGKRRAELASMVQFSMPGAPTVYYGDEVGVTGDDDPDDRRAFPWADLGGHPDLAMREHYATLAQVRRAVPALRDGDLRVLATDDTAGTVALGRRDGSSAAVLVLNRGSAARTVTVPLSGYLPDGLKLTETYRVGGATAGAHVVTSGAVSVDVPALGGVWLTATGADLTPPAAPTGVHVDEGSTSLTVTWSATARAASYDVLVSPLPGGGYVRANAAPVTGTSFTVEGLQPARPYYVVVRAVDGAGNIGPSSAEVRAMPHDTIGWANLQWPSSMTHTISATDRTDNVYGQVWIDGVTSQPGPAPGLRAQLGFGPDGTDPASAGWTWVDAAFNTQAGNNDEFVASLLPEQVGSFDYAYRYSTTAGESWVYADLDGIGNGYSPQQAGALTVNPSADTTAPATPTGLHVVTAGPAAVELAWDALTLDPTVYGYEVVRTAGGTSTTLGRTTDPSWTDTTVTQGESYAYQVRAVDTSLNRSGLSAPVQATAQVRKVSVTFTVTVPSTTDGTGRSVNIAGFLDRLDGGLPQWDPAGAPLTRVDATHWRVTFTGDEGTQLEYKYALGSWDYVEKDGACGEIGNRQLTLAYGSDGTQAVDDTVANWRNVAPCGN